MIYIIAGNYQQANRYIREKNFNPRNCFVISSVEHCNRLRGRRWYDEDHLEWIGTWYELDYSSIRIELRIMGVPENLFL